MKNNSLPFLLTMTLCPGILSFSGTYVRVVPPTKQPHTNYQRMDFKFMGKCAPLSSTEVRGSLFDDFTTADGDTINPYSVLNIDKSASRREIRQAYRYLTKQYHPDRVMFVENIPGQCVDLNEARFEWERIKLANEVLSDKRLRLKYDRIEAIHHALDDPVFAICQVMDALGWCATEIGKGLLKLGDSAVDYVEKRRKDIEVFNQPSLVLAPAFVTNSGGRTETRVRTFSSGIMDANPTPSTTERRSIKGGHLPTFTNPLRSNILSPSLCFRRPLSSSTALGYSRNDESFLLEDFTTADGEVINPYRVLKVGRYAERSEIRQSYRNLSKKYHPDGVRFRQVMPGKCNNLDEVRDEWERIKLSYEILSDKKMRLKYDRHEAIHDPLGAMGRATLSTMGWAVMETGRGIFSLGGMAVKHVTNISRQTNEDSTTSSSIEH